VYVRAGDGKLQIEELVNNLELLNEHSVNGDELMSAFRAFDTDNDGHIRLPFSRSLLRAFDINDSGLARPRVLCVQWNPI
jgi:EF-hand domain pair